MGFKQNHVKLFSILILIWIIWTQALIYKFKYYHRKTPVKGNNVRGIMILATCDWTRITQQLCYELDWTWIKINLYIIKVKQVTMNMTGPPQNIWMFCITIEHKSSCDTKILLFAAWHRAKLWVHSLGLPKHTQNVRINLQEIFVFICSQKYTSSILFSFRYCKILSTSYFG